MLLPPQLVPPLQVRVRIILPPLQLLEQRDQGDHEDQEDTDPVPLIEEGKNIY